ncbi:MAG: hypothetical protein HPY52_10700 [Firmicutes bacterium]|nr:hypothetical protein [Bacillota bacterium]
MSICTGHRVILRDGTEWSILDIDWKHKLVRLGDRLKRPRELRAVAFREIREIAGWDAGDGIIPIEEEDDSEE